MMSEISQPDFKIKLSILAINDLIVNVRVSFYSRTGAPESQARDDRH